MYTVIRFYPTDERGSEISLRQVGEELNAIRPGSFEELSPLSKSFGVSITKSAIWWDHLSEMETFLRHCGRFIRKIRLKRIETQFSVAIGREDYENHNVLMLPLSIELIHAMTQFGVTIDFRFYNGGGRNRKAVGRPRKRRPGPQQRGRRSMAAGGTGR